MTTVSERGIAQPQARGAHRPLSLRRNFSFTLVGNVIYAASNWAMLVLIAKLGSAVMLGQFALGLAVAQPIIIFAQLNLRSVQATDQRHEYRFGDYLALRLVMICVALLCMAGAGFVGQSDRLTGMVIFVTGVGVCFDAISDVIYGLLQQRERMDYPAVSMALKGPLSLLGVAGGIALAHSVLWAAIGSALASLVVVLFYDIPCLLINVRHVPGETGGWRPRWNPAVLLGLWWLALPAGITMSLVAVNMNMSRYMVQQYLGARELGIFAALASLLRIGFIVVSALGQSASPRMAQYYLSGDTRAFTRLLGRLVAIGAAIGLGAPLAAAVIGRPVLRLLFKPEYAAHLDVFVIILAAGGMSYVGSFLGYGITAARWFRIQVVWSLGVTAVAVATGVWLVPHGGLRGAAVSTLLTYLAQLIGGLVILTFVVRAAQRRAEAVVRAPA